MDQRSSSVNVNKGRRAGWSSGYLERRRRASHVPSQRRDLRAPLP
jgi:hypothetical protein